ncbi:MAG TPA: 5-(carboxyamino)imidazole ribonucleotide synthase [Mycobacteriales bacterium]|nr:5-(carboxyamino)imidazole ribonucleotide synthase [Mycobacteriales bacterium]
MTPRGSTPGPIVGMVGAGQLARMTQQAAIGLGLSMRLLAESADDGAALVTPSVEIGAPDDEAAVERFAKTCDVVTFDHEHVPQPILVALERSGVTVRPGASALRFAQDKRAMRRRLVELGLPVPAWSEDPTGLPRPFVAKAVTGGYDGRGVWFIGEGDPLPDVDIIVEERVSIVHELAIQVARTPSGRIRTWPVVETVQRDGICVEVVAPAPRLSPTLANDAEQLAITIANELDVVGVMAVELFEAPSGLLVNELAMRPHNSGHWTIEGSVTSQFEQHLRAVLDWPLGDTRPRAPVSVMVNLLGGEHTDLAASLPAALAAVPDASVHLYGKQARPGRKLGHVTVLGDDVVSVRERARRAVAVLRGDES